MIGGRIQSASPALPIDPYAHRISVIPPEPEPMTQFPGLDALKALAMTQPLEIAHSGQQVCDSGAQDSALRRLAGRVWQHRFRLVIFAANGMNVFAVGLLIQVILVRYAGMGYVPSYIVQTVASVQLAFLLSRFVTWRDRDAAILPALARFNVQQLIVTGLGMAGYAGLERLGINYIAANIAVTAVLTPVSFLSSHKWSLSGCAGKVRPSLAIRMGCGVAAAAAFALACVMNPRFLLILGITGAAGFCMTLGVAETYWRMYCWWTPGIMDGFAWPEAVKPEEATLAFSILVAALNEVPNLAPTLEQLAKQDHPNYEIVVALCSCDGETIAEARRMEGLHPYKIRLVIRQHSGRHRKAYQLNEAIATVGRDENRRVVIADAEGGMHPQILRYFEARFAETEADVVQGGVQLMNLGDSVFTWFQVFAAMEYKAWFEGNMARQAGNGVVLFGGNTIAFTLAHLVGIGGIPDSLTEDGVAGILTALVGGRVAVAYSPELCTRELVPPTVFDKRKGSLFFQRVRWVHGFVEELLRMRWRQLPTWRQRRSAGYGLASPVLQAISSVLIPVAIASAVLAKVPIGLSILTFAPLVPYTLVMVAQLMHLADFGRRFDQKVRVWHYLAIIFLPPLYQMILIGAAAVALWRHLLGRNDWYRTGRAHDEKVAASARTEAVAA